MMFESSEDLLTGQNRIRERGRFLMAGGGDRIPSHISGSCLLGVLFRLKNWLIAILFVSTGFWVRAIPPHSGLPAVRNYSRSQYSGGMQTWSFAQANNGMMYFANNSGLLEYNGNTWSLYNSIKAVHRVVYADGNRVYVGAFNDFGYYEENERGNLLYHSLSNLIKEKTGDFDEIWRIHKTNFGIVFQSFKALFIYQNEQIKTVTPPSRFHFSYFVNDILWIFDEEKGLMQYQDGVLKSAPKGEFFIGTNIWSIIALDNRELLICTNSKGVFRYNGTRIIPWESKINERLKRYQIFSAIRLNNNYLAFGTVQNGLIVTDTNGSLVFEINKDRGLQNNTVLGIGQDKRGNIWLCLDNGISMIEVDSPISYLQNYLNIGTGYASAKLGNNLYLGTNQGLFFIPWEDFMDPSKSKTNFTLIEGTEGQVWNLTIIDNTLLCGHNNGVFQVLGTTASKISSASGAWNFLKINHADLVMVGTYTGLLILEKSNGIWRVRNKMDGFHESSRFVQMDPTGDIWVSQSYKGIFRLKTDREWRRVQQVKLYNSNNGLPSDQSNLLFNIQSEILVATEKGIHRFNDRTGNFVSDPKYTPYFGTESKVDYLYQDPRRNIWFYAGGHLGVLRIQEDGSFKKIVLPFSKLSEITIPAFEHVNEIDPNNALIGIQGGFANYNSTYDKDYALPSTIYISDIRSRDTSEGIFRFNNKIENQILVPAFRYKNNTISIAFAANNFDSEFQFKLLGFDTDWSEWTNQKFKEYTNLSPGDYTFQLRSRDNDQAVPAEIAYRFVILAPWYRTNIALVCYFILFFLFIYFMYRFISLKIEKSRLEEKRKQKEKYLLKEQELKAEALAAEKEMERLRNEALRLEMIHKEKELANSTMLLIKKNNILQKLQTDLKNILTMGDDPARNNLKGLIKRIEKEIDNEKQWKVFDMHIEQVYEELFKKLKSAYPDLTPRELSLCAYLRMNISSKEIATLMNISARGVEISRYRIRKKLRLDREANLTEFMIQL